LIEGHYKVPVSPKIEEEVKHGVLEEEDEDDIVMLEDDYEAVVRDN
jgi:serine/threonine kinase 38